jgi:hypothetical protein
MRASTILILALAVLSALAIDPGHVEANLSLIQFLLEAPGIAAGDKTQQPRPLSCACHRRGFQRRR